MIDAVPGNRCHHIINSPATYLLIWFDIVAYVSSEGNLLCSHSYVCPSLTNSCSRYNPTIIWNESGWSSNRRNMTQNLQRSLGVFRIPKEWFLVELYLPLPRTLEGPPIHALVGRHQYSSLMPHVWRLLKGGRIKLQRQWRTDNIRYQAILLGDFARSNGARALIMSANPIDFTKVRWELERW